MYLIAFVFLLVFDMALALNTQLPYVPFNLIIIIVCALLLLWLLKAMKNFHKVLRIRAAILSDRIVRIKGLGSYLSYFEGATPSHVHSIVHTRQSKPPISMQNIYEPFHMTSIVASKNNNDINLFFELFTSVQAKILILLNFNPHEFKKYITNDLRGRDRGANMHNKTFSSEFQSTIFNLNGKSNLNNELLSSGIVYNNEMNDKSFEHEQVSLGDICDHSALLSPTLLRGKYNVTIRGKASILGTIAIVLLPQSFTSFNVTIKKADEEKVIENCSESSNAPIEDLSIDIRNKVKPIKESLLSQYFYPNFRSITSTTSMSGKSSDHLLDRNSRGLDRNSDETGSSNTLDDVTAGVFWIRTGPFKSGSNTQSVPPSELLIIDRQGIMYTSQEVFGLTQVEANTSPSSTDQDGASNSSSSISNRNDIRCEEPTTTTIASSSIVNSTTCSGGILPSEECVVCLTGFSNNYYCF